MALDISKIRNGNLTEDEKMEMIADYLDAQKSVPDDITLYVPDSAQAGSGTLTLTPEEYEAIKGAVIYNIFHGAVHPTGEEHTSPGPFLVKEKRVQIMLVCGRDFWHDGAVPEWGEMRTLASCEYADGEWETIYLTFSTNWESFNGFNYTSISISKYEDGSIETEWTTTEPSRES